MGEIQRQTGKRAAQSACGCSYHVIFGHEDGCRYEGMGPTPGPVDLLPPVSAMTKLTNHGSTALTVLPPAPCALDGCVAELLVVIRSDAMRVHLSGQQRRELIAALGGEIR